MSIEALSWVLKHSEAVKGARLVLLALADTADDDGANTWPSVKTLARKARLSPRAVHNALRTLEENGRIIRRGTTEFSTTRWDIAMEEPSAQSADPPVQSATPEPTKTAHKPSIEPSTTTAPPIIPPGWDDFLAFHEKTTGMKPPREGTKARKQAEATFAARLAENWTLDDLKAAVRAAQADDHRRENGYTTITSVLRPTKVGDLVARGQHPQQWNRNGLRVDVPDEDRENYRRIDREARERIKEAEHDDDNRSF